MLKLIARFINFLEGIPPSEEYLSNKSLRYWLLREHMENLNREVPEFTEKAVSKK